MFKVLRVVAELCEALHSDAERGVASLGKDSFSQGLARPSVAIYGGAEHIKARFNVHGTVLSAVAGQSSAWHGLI